MVRRKKVRNPLRNREIVVIHQGSVQEKDPEMQRETSITLMLVGTN